MTGSAGSGRLGLGGMSRGALGCVARSRFAPAEELGRFQARVAHGKSESLRKSTLRYHDFQSTSLAIELGNRLTSCLERLRPAIVEAVSTLRVEGKASAIRCKRRLTVGESLLEGGQPHPQPQGSVLCFYALVIRHNLRVLTVIRNQLVIRRSPRPSSPQLDALHLPQPVPQM